MATTLGGTGGGRAYRMWPSGLEEEKKKGKARRIEDPGETECATYLGTHPSMYSAFCTK